MGSNIETDDLGIVHLPLYAPCFFKEVKTSDIPEPPSADDLNERYLQKLQIS